MRWSIFSVFLFFIPLVSSAETNSDYRYKDALSTSGVQFQVKDKDGNAIPFFTDKGIPNLKLDQNQEYSLVVKNSNKHRVAVSFSLNNKNPINGKKSYQGQPGVLLPPESSYVLSKSKSSKKSESSNLFKIIEEEKWGAVIVYDEAPDYPMLGTGFPEAPHKNENYYVDSKGVRRWIPPHSFPFRRMGLEPAGRIQFKYSVFGL